MKLIKPITWNEVFEGWRAREANNPGWIRCATEIKGWPDWESWRKFTASQIDAEHREWSLFEFENPLEEIPRMLIGPYSGWQSRIGNTNSASFADLLNIPEQYEHFSTHTGVLSILKGLPFSTELIGIIRDDTGQIVCLEGHHRAVAITITQRQGTPIDFSKSTITIALTHLPADECLILDDILKRGTSKNPKS